MMKHKDDPLCILTGCEPIQKRLLQKAHKKQTNINAFLQQPDSFPLPEYMKTAPISMRPGCPVTLVLEPGMTALFVDVS
jgi:hypothetical protein